ncbi:hypothetical protein M5X11_25605 [Paenibacillus alginolyticus]|uniref:hypothetical protein n=1 Tax=Paenibacillus alginolyticus TaxID=59839 RepID=UPI000492299B|nr:hypothetical protein [Paenibacillus alginolyticus]MCY9668260.1 hypothetical protein [Paenibacillus alginolyticus]
MDPIKKKTIVRTKKKKVASLRKKKVAKLRKKKVASLRKKKVASLRKKKVASLRKKKVASLRKKKVASLRKKKRPGRLILSANHYSRFFRPPCKAIRESVNRKIWNRIAAELPPAYRAPDIDIVRFLVRYRSSAMPESNEVVV